MFNSLEISSCKILFGSKEEGGEREGEGEEEEEEEKEEEEEETLF